jgi:hypothetical protein
VCQRAYVTAKELGLKGEFPNAYPLFDIDRTSVEHSVHQRELRGECHVLCVSVPT